MNKSHDSWATLVQPCSEDRSLPELRKSIKPLASQFLFVMSRWASAMTSFKGNLVVAIPRQLGGVVYIPPREPWSLRSLGMGARRVFRRKFGLHQVQWRWRHVLRVTGLCEFSFIGCTTLFSDRRAFFFCRLNCSALQDLRSRRAVLITRSERAEAVGAL
jgi:hypothetical protein